MKELLIAIPTVDYIHWRFVKSLTALSWALNDEGITHDISFSHGTLLYLKRDELVDEAIEGKYERVLWLDADMVFEPDIYNKLKANEKPFVSGVFRSRHDGFKSTIFSNIQNPTRVDSFPEELFEIAGCGFATVLTDTDILRKIRENYGSPFRPTALFSEDLAFCARCYDLGIPLYADGRVKIGHITQGIVEPDKTVTIM